MEGLSLGGRELSTKDKISVGLRIEEDYSVITQILRLLLTEPRARGTKRCTV